MKAVTLIRSSAQLQGLQRQVQPLVGEPCWRARLAYAQELKLDFGKKVPYKSNKLRGLAHGSWRLGSRGTTWRLESANRSISSRSRLPNIEEALGELAGGTVMSVAIGYRQLELSIQFDSGSMLTIQHEAGRPTHDVPYWELFTPRGASIQAGPGRRWSIGEERGRA